MLWRSALLAAARNLRQNILRGRIWGHPVSDSEQAQDQEQEQGQGDAPFASALYASSSSSLDLPLTGEDADFGSEHRLTRRSRATTNAKGRVRGMVDKWERESTGSRSPTRNSGDSGHNRSSSESDNGSEPGEGEVVAMQGDVDVRGTRSEPVSPFPGNPVASVPAVDDEPTIEDLLATGSALSAPMDGSWGARAWEELDVGLTMRRVEQHDTIVPRRDASGGSSADVGSTAFFGARSKRGGGSSSRRMRATNKEDPSAARRPVADIFAESPDTVSTPALAEAEVQADVCAEIDLEEEAAATVALEAELEAKELALESEARATRGLLEEFRRRLEEVEARVSAMEVEWHPPEEQQAPISQQPQQPQARGTSTAETDTHDNAIEARPKTADITPELDAVVAATAETSADERKVGGHKAVENGSADLGAHGAYAEGRVVRQTMVDLGPTTVSDLPSYVFLVGLGVCAVVLQVVLKRVGGRSLKP